MSKQSNLHIATLGRAVGLFGEMKLHLFTDFEDQFVPGTVLNSSRGQIEIEDIDLDRLHIKLKNVATREAAKAYTNAKIYTTKEQTREICNLEEDEHFWFDVIGCDIYEDGLHLGKVEDIDRLAVSDYLFIQTDEKLVGEGSAKTFLLPYIDRFILQVDIENKRIDVNGAKDILEAS